MNPNDHDECIYIRQLSSADAATFLIQNYQSDFPTSISHRSWVKADQIRLAHHFLRNLPHASGCAYNSLLSFMSIAAFISVIEMKIIEMILLFSIKERYQKKLNV